MSVYATSDLHGQLFPIPEDCETLLIAGDICPDFSRDAAHGAFRQAHWLDTVFRGWLATTDATVVACWGNHDFIGEHPREVPALPWTLLQDSEAVVNGLRVHGTPWVPGLPYWAFYAREKALAVRAEAIPEGLDVLMSHGPPFMFGDFIPTSEKQRTKYGNYSGVNVGEKSLNVAIARVKPKVTICGHIHEARGPYRVAGEHELWNVAAVDGFYKPYDRPFTRLDL